MAHGKRGEHENQGSLDLTFREDAPPMSQSERDIVGPVSANVVHLVTNYESKIKIGSTEVWFISPRNRIKRNSDGTITQLELKISGERGTLVAFKIDLEKYTIRHKTRWKNQEPYDFVDNLVINSIVKVSRPRIFGDKDGCDIRDFGYFRYLEGTLRLPGLMEKIKTELNNAILHFSRNSL